MSLSSRSAVTAAVFQELRRLFVRREFSPRQVINAAAGHRGRPLTEALRSVMRVQPLTSQRVGIWLNRHRKECLGLTLAARYVTHSKAWRYKVVSPRDAAAESLEDAARRAAKLAYSEVRQGRGVAIPAPVSKKPAPIPRVAVQRALIQCRDTHGEAAARKLLHDVGGVTELYALPPEKFDAVIEACRALPPDQQADVTPPVELVSSPEAVESVASQSPGAQKVQLVAEPAAVPEPGERLPSWVRRGLSAPPHAQFSSSEARDLRRPAAHDYSSRRAVAALDPSATGQPRRKPWSPFD